MQHDEHLWARLQLLETRGLALSMKKLEKRREGSTLMSSYLYGRLAAVVEVVMLVLRLLC